MTLRAKLSPKSPAASSRFGMPAEWEPHDSTWLAWPHYQGDWPGKFEPIPWVYAEIIRALGPHERVQLIVSDAAAEKSARKILERANALSEAVSFHRWPTDRVWTRDSGCTFVVDSAQRELGAVHWRFTAWAKYKNFHHDARIGGLMADAAHAGILNPEFAGWRVVLEGGSIDSNGAGVLLTTEECLLSPIQQRNPGMARKNYEQIFFEYLGMEQVVWLGRGIAGDDTHGHVDDITRFVAGGTVLTMVEPNSRDVNAAPLRHNLTRLRAARDARGTQFQIVELPMPRPVIFAGRRLPASYANFYIANRVVLVPVFNDPNDRVALNTLAELFPDREIAPIYCGDLIWGFGALHCMTQQQPALL